MMRSRSRWPPLKTDAPIKPKIWLPDPTYKNFIKESELTILDRQRVGVC